MNQLRKGGRMRIQETDRILKESRYSRSASHETEQEGRLSRLWKSVAHVPARLTGLFRRH